MTRALFPFFSPALAYTDRDPRRTEINTGGAIIIRRTVRIISPPIRTVVSGIISRIVARIIITGISAVRIITPIISSPSRSSTVPALSGWNRRKKYQYGENECKNPLHKKSPPV